MPPERQLVALLEVPGGGPILVSGLLAALLVARDALFGLFAARTSKRHFACRGGGIPAALPVIAVAAVALLLRVG